MALSPYAITVPRTAVTVDATARTGQFSVDVENTQSVLDRVVLDIEAVTPTPGPASPPPEPADETWFAVQDHLRPIPSGGSEQYLVAVTVPTSGKPGSYLMRPVAYSAMNPPDDTKVSGPLMTLVVPAPPGPPELPWWKKYWPWWLVGAIAAVLLIVAVVVVVLALSGGGGGTTPVPTTTVPVTTAPATTAPATTAPATTAPATTRVTTRPTIPHTTTSFNPCAHTTNPNCRQP